MLEEIKLSMRISHDKLDTDIQRNIDTCLRDLARVGVDSSNEADFMLRRACELFVKWQYDYCGKGEQYQKNYEALRDALSMSEEYRGGTNV